MTSFVRRLSKIARIGDANRRLQQFRYSKDYNRFIVIGQARSGTTYVQTMLDSHNQIIARGEIFHLISKPNDLLHELINNPLEYVNRRVYASYPPQIAAVGFKMVYSEIGGDNVFLRKMETEDVAAETKVKRKQFSRFMQENYNLAKARQRFDELLNFLEKDVDIQVVHIKRENLLETFLSKKLAGLSGAWSSKKGAYLPGALHLDHEDALRFFETTATLRKKYDAIFQNHKVVDVIYEELQADPEAASKMMQRHLGVDYQILSSPLRKQNQLRPQTVIANYFELREQFAHTEWVQFFE